MSILIKPIVDPSILSDARRGRLVLTKGRATMVVRSRPCMNVILSRATHYTPWLYDVLEGKLSAETEPDYPWRSEMEMVGMSSRKSISWFHFVRYLLFYSFFIPPSLFLRIIATIFLPFEDSTPDSVHTETRYINSNAAWYNKPLICYRKRGLFLKEEEINRN